MNIKHLLTVSLAVFLSACNNQSNSVPIQSNSGGYDGEYQNAPITNTPLTNTEALAVGAVGVATGYAVGKYANKPKASYSKPAVVVNKHYYQTKQKVKLSRYKRK